MLLKMTNDEDADNFLAYLSLRKKPYVHASGGFSLNIDQAVPWPRDINNVLSYTRHRVTHEYPLAGKFSFFFLFCFI